MWANLQIESSLQIHATIMIQKQVFQRESGKSFNQSLTLKVRLNRANERRNRTEDENQSIRAKVDELRRMRITQNEINTGVCVWYNIHKINSRHSTE